jgi:ferric-dicitrate binding protein FerR (iron transport regulator)
MRLEEFDVNDFLTDESFYLSVKNPNSEEGLFWKAWLNDHPDKRELAEHARRILLSIGFQDKSFNNQEITELWSSIKNETILSPKISHLETDIKTPFNPWKYLKVAAVVFPFLIAAVLFLFYREAPVEQPVPLSETIEKFNPKGQKLTVFLSDGSKVKLNAESKIRYQKPLDEDSRVVYLEGEAFFEVVPDKSRPFIVRSANLETRVLGTSFNVKAYPNERTINVAVKTGMVSVSNTEQKLVKNQNKSIVLSPSEMVSFTLASKDMSVTKYDPKEVLSWSEGILYFNDATMEQFVARLERWYGIDIVVDRKTKIKKGIVGEFKDQSLEEILLGTHEASEFEYEFKNDKVIIK